MKIYKFIILKLFVLLIISAQVFPKTPTIDYSVAWFIDNVKLLYTIEEVQKLYPSTYLIIQKNKIRIYETKYPKNDRSWTFNFYKFSNDTYLLTSLFYETEGTYDSYKQSINSYDEALKIDSDRSKPGVIPFYISYWETGSGETKTRLTVSYDPKNNTIKQLLSLDLYALKNSDIMEIRKLILFTS